MKELDFNDNKEDSPVCPYCKNTGNKFFENCGAHEEEITCRTCGKFYISEVESTYRNKGDCFLNKELPHKLIFLYKIINGSVFKCEKCHGIVFNPRKDNTDFEFPNS